MGRQLYFTLMLTPGSRKRDLLPVRLRHQVKDVIFTSETTLVIQVYGSLIHIDLNGTFQSQDDEEGRQVVEKCNSIIYKSEARESTEVLIGGEEFYARLRYDIMGQAKIVSQITQKQIRE